jgi:hypothetical protein
MRFGTAVETVPKSSSWAKPSVNELTEYVIAEITLVPQIHTLYK